MIRGACPSLQRPMATGDGLLVRLQLAEPMLAPGQVLGLAEAAFRYGNGILDITARGNIQLRGLDEKGVASLTGEIGRLGIGHQTGPAVAMSPLAGLDPFEMSDPRPLAAELRHEMQQLSLHPKTGILLDSGGQFDLGQRSADIRLSAVARQCWQLSLGGHGPVGVAEEKHVLPILRRLLGRLTEYSPAVRTASLLEDFPGEALRRLLEKEGLAPPVAQIARSSAPPAIYKCRGGSMALPVGVPFGQVEWGQLKTLAKLAQDNGAHISPAPGRVILLAGLGEGAIRDLRRHLEESGFITAQNDPRHRLFACSGAPACASAHIAARDIARSLIPHMPERGLVHVSGCAKGCAHQGPSRLALVGLPGGAIAMGPGGPDDLNLARTRICSPEGAAAAFRAALAEEDVH